MGGGQQQATGFQQSRHFGKPLVLRRRIQMGEQRHAVDNVEHPAGISCRRGRAVGREPGHGGKVFPRPVDGLRVYVRAVHVAGTGGSRQFADDPARSAGKVKHDQALQHHAMRGQRIEQAVRNTVAIGQEAGRIESAMHPVAQHGRREAQRRHTGVHPVRPRQLQAELRIPRGTDEPVQRRDAFRHLTQLFFHAARRTSCHALRPCWRVDSLSRAGCPARRGSAHRPRPPRSC